MSSYEYWDIATNKDLSSGYNQCHTSLDILLDATGDIALIHGQDELKQRFLLYLAIPKGERYDPKIGCSCLDHLHEKNTTANMRLLEQEIESDMKYQFPEISINSVTCNKSITDPFQMDILVRSSQGNTLEFLYTPSELMSLTSTLSNMINYY